MMAGPAWAAGVGWMLNVMVDPRSSLAPNPDGKSS